MEIALTNGLVNLGNRGYNSIYSSYNLTTGGPILLWGVPKFNGKVHRNSIGQIPWKPEKKHLIKEKLLEKHRPGNPCDLFGMVSSHDPKSKVIPHLQRN